MEFEDGIQQSKVLDNYNNPIWVDKLANELDSSQWYRVYLRDSERKEMLCRLAYLQVFPVKDNCQVRSAGLLFEEMRGN